MPIHDILHSKGNHILCIDPSANHLAYALCHVNKDTMNMNIVACGMIWTKPTWSRGQRLSYVKHCIQSIIESPINASQVTVNVYSEGFFVNPSQMIGFSDIPTVNGIIEMICFETQVQPEFSEIPPTEWRKVLSIKPNMDNVLQKDGSFKKKRDYKIPTLKAVEQALGKLPDKIISNITLKERDMPYDVSDALAIALAVAKSNGFKPGMVFGSAFSNLTHINEFQKNIK